MLRRKQPHALALRSHGLAEHLAALICISGHGPRARCWLREPNGRGVGERDHALCVDVPAGCRARHCRVFNLVSIINIRRGLATGRRLATCTARPRPGCSLSVCVFEVPLEELEPLAMREARLRLAPVRVEKLGGDDEAATAALLCLESSDDEYRERWCGADADAYHEQVGQYYDGRLYRDDCLPVPSYLIRCMRAHAAAGTVGNFLDASFLGDGRTTLRAHAQAEADDAGCGWSADERREVRALCAGA